VAVGVFHVLTVIAAPDRRFFFAGDTGYHAGLAEIGRRLGSLDLAALPIGGCTDFRHHHLNHLSPEESVRAFEDLHGRLLVPMHRGTFELNREPSRESPDRLMAEALRQGLEEHVAPLSPGQTIRWYSDAMLAAWGRAVHRLRWWLVALSLLPLLLWLGVTPGERLDESVVPPEMESVRAVRLLDEELAPRPPSFGLIFSSATLAATDPRFVAEVERALAPLRRDHRVTRLRTPWDGPRPDPRQLGKDGRRAAVIVEVEGRAPAFASMVVPSAPPGLYSALRGQVRADTLEILPFGPMALNHDFTEMVKADLHRAELVVLPLVLAFLVLVFGSVVAAALPLAVGLLGVAAGMATTGLLARVMPVSAYASNVVSMIGLGVAIDYSLFVVSRYREELAVQAPPPALARTLATAGRTVVFSGMTVGIGLVGMILLRMGSVSTIGIASTVVVAFAVLYSLTLLPALLAILGPRVNALSVWRRPERSSDTWQRLASAAMARPWHVLVPVAVLLVVLGLPFRHIHLGTPDVRTLPPSAESRRGQEVLARELPDLDPTSVVVVLHYAEATGLTPARMDELFTLSRWLAARPGVARVDSPVDLDPRITREQYRQIAAAPPEMLPPPIREALARMAGERVAILIAQTPLPVDGSEARTLVRTIRTSHPPVAAELLVTGRTAYDVDFVALVARVAPGAVAFVLAATFVALFLLLGSVLLPLKAVVMNCLSVTASYGALVWIFQQGHGQDVLGFTPAPIEPVIPLIMFCVLFGLSMDYEVLLLSRTHEEFERTLDNDRAVVASLAATGRLITGAALIMATVFFGFGAARAVMIKEMGIGMGIAIVMDATVIRALLVPATMRLLGDWNWWAPAPLKRLRRLVRAGAGV
jgi:RND superfamily putative drug exporter